MDAPPVLTAERIDAMLSIMAEVCLESVVESGRRQKDAPDAEAFERGGRTLQRACRNLRQTIALKQRFDRDQAAKAEGARKVVQAERAEAERVYRHRVDRRKAELERHFERVLWDEYEPSDAQELFEELTTRVKDAGFEDDFLEAPVEALIARFSDEIGVATNGPPTPGPAAKPHSTSEDAEASAKIAETPRLRALSETSATSAVERGACGAHGPQPMATAEAPAPTARPPPDEGYIPPWERLRPGQRMPGGGTGW